MSDKELKLKGDQNFDDLRDVWERIEALEKKIKDTNLYHVENRLKDCEVAIAS